MPDDYHGVLVRDDYAGWAKFDAQLAGCSNAASTYPATSRASTPCTPTGSTGPKTSNASEQAIKGPKRHQAVSGYWHSLATLARYFRVRSYLVTSRNHGTRPTDAIHAALTGRPWLPVPASEVISAK